jgi:hypothetical protein
MTLVEYIRYPAANWPKDTLRSTGIETIAAVRWVDGKTLMLERTTSSAYGPNTEKLWRLTAEITVSIDKEGKAAVASVEKQKQGNR